MVIGCDRFPWDGLSRCPKCGCMIFETGWRDSKVQKINNKPHNYHDCWCDDWKNCAFELELQCHCQVNSYEYSYPKSLLSGENGLG